jgi:hypothetical protein
VRFELGGTFARWIVGQLVEYKVHYYFEGMGQATEGELPPVPAPPKKTVAGKLIYGPPETSLLVPANTLKPGLYKLTAVVTFEGNPPMTAFTEGPIIEIFP